MATVAILGAQAQQAREKALAVIEEHGVPERAEKLQNMTITAATTRNPNLLDAVSAELVAGLAEIVEGLVSDKAALIDRITALENPPTAAAATGAKKAGKKA